MESYTRLVHQANSLIYCLDMEQEDVRFSWYLIEILQADNTGLVIPNDPSFPSRIA